MTVENKEKSSEEILNGKHRKKITWTTIVIGVVIGLGLIDQAQEAERGFIDLWHFLGSLNENNAAAATMLLVIIIGMFVLTYAIYVSYVKSRQGRFKLHTRIEDSIEEQQKFREKIGEWQGDFNARLINVEEYQRTDVAISRLKEKET